MTQTTGHGGLFAGESPQRGRGRGRPPLDVSKLFDRLPPHAPEAEMALLGSMILDPQRIGEVLSFVAKAEDFYSARNGAIFSALLEVYEKHQAGDLVEITDALRGKNVLDDVGGPEYLVQLAEAVPSAVNAVHYARIVSDKSKLRRLIEAAGEVMYDAYHAGDLGPDSTTEVLDRAEMAVFKIAQEDEKSDPQKLSDLLQMELDRLEAVEGKGISGLATGFDELDRILAGLQAGEMIIVAGRPSMGKTALALNLAEQISLGGKTPWSPAAGPPAPVGVFSLEMSKASVTQRLLSAYSGFDSHRMRTGALNEREFAEVMRHAAALSEAPIYVDDSPNLTVLALRARARRMSAHFHVKALMVDYLQLLSAPAVAKESRQVEVSAISRGIKALARELNVPVICLAQLNRGAESREGNRPRMSDLRESGSIEQDADVVILIHREDYYHANDEEWKSENEDKIGLTELIVAKQRNGPTGVVHLRWDPKTTRFKNDSPEPMRGGGEYIDAPFDAPVQIEPKARPGAGFVPGRKTGPIDGHRDGGGPDRSLSEGDEGDIGLS
jgi:replicative DNA helicase